MEFLIKSIDDPAARNELLEIQDNNLGLVDVADFDGDVQRQVLRLLRDDLVPDARQHLRPDIGDREGYLQVLQQLSDMARTAIG